MLGVDGCPGGWIGAQLDDGTTVTWHLLADAASVLALAVDVVGIDIPIGLPDGGRRTCDTAARRLLGRRGTTVFTAPVRAVLGATSYAEACALSRRDAGRAMSRQAWAIVPRIRAVDAALGDRADVLEVHPEVSFRTMAGRDLPSKHGIPGIAARIAALQTWLPGVLGDLERVPAGPRLDDALDALAVAWTARRWVSGAATVLPDPAPADARGRPMRIVV